MMIEETIVAGKASGVGKRPPSADRQEMPVVRDATFFRTVVDQALVIPLGRDLEIGCLQGGPDIEKLVDIDEMQQLQLKPVMSEVARLRLGWPEAVGLAMQILDIGIKRDHIDSGKVVEAIKLIVDRAARQSDDEVGDVE